MNQHLVENDQQVQDVIILLNCGHWATTQPLTTTVAMLLDEMKRRRSPICYRCSPRNEEALIVFIGSRSVDRIWIEER